MTHITLQIGKQNYRIKASGHSGTTETCIAVSAIISTLAGWVENTDGQHYTSLDKGEAVIVFPKSDGADTAFEMTVIGLLQVRKAAPDDMTIDIISEDETS